VSHSVHVFLYQCVVFCPTMYLSVSFWFSGPLCICVCIIVSELDQRDEGHSQYADDRRRQSDVSSRRDRRGSSPVLSLLSVPYLTLP